MQIRLLLALFVFSFGLAASRGAEILAPQPGTPLRQTILDDLRAAEPTVSTQKEKKQKIIFDKVVLRVSGEWAWFSVSPRTPDGKWQSEPMTGLAHHRGGHWKVMEYVGDEVASADEPQKAYQAWRVELLKKNPQCPPELVPKKG
ncbi:MAG: hypothetical protein ABJF10_01160 [Chthoniobacter sp.]|uniref:hypothetical protein n=1 Tax=Chthoniobacter sp. TaxID=2510640 RepID=UPI0032A607B8